MNKCKSIFISFRCFNFIYYNKDCKYGLGVKGNIEFRSSLLMNKLIIIMAAVVAADVGRASLPPI